MFNVIIFGPPGSGKGTQSQNIIKKYGLTHLSTGDLLREEIANETPIGKEAKKFIDKGNLVPDELVIAIIDGEIKKNIQNGGLLFDGFPRTVAQAEALEKLLKVHNTAIDVVLLLEVTEEELVKRILGRGKTSGRSDDNEVTVKERITEYKKKTAPVADFYKSINKTKTIKGVGSIEEIFNAIAQTINLLQNAKQK